MVHPSRTLVVAAHRVTAVRRVPVALVVHQVAPAHQAAAHREPVVHRPVVRGQAHVPAEALAVLVVLAAAPAEPGAET